jgi:repressor LexA
MDVMMGDDTSYLSILQDYYAEQRVMPSFAKICQLLKFSSRASAAALVARLKLQGFLEATETGRLKPGKRFFDRILADDVVRAGMPSPSHSGSSDTLTIDEYLVGQPSRTLLIPVKGDSMVDAGILPDDIVVVEKRQLANVGDIVVAIVDGEFTLKTLGREKGEFVLYPANKAYPVIRPEGQLEIFGVVVGQFRKYS